MSRPGPRYQQPLARAIIWLTLVLLVSAQSGCAAMPPLAHQGTANPQKQRLEQLATATHYRADWFSVEMRAAKSPGELHSLLQTVSAELGHFQRVEQTGHDFRLIYAHGAIPARIYLDGRDRITGLWYDNPVFNDQDDASRAEAFATAVNRIESLPGEIGLQVVRDNTVLAEYQANRPLAVGSAFKLSVLAALEKAYSNGRLKPQTLVHLKNSDRAPPSGQMQNWPSGTPVTLATAAALMMSISDNTATDLLIRVLGREHVEAEAPTRNRPFLTVRELFTLKAQSNASLADDWQESTSPADRRDLLKRIDERPLPGQRELLHSPDNHTSIEWFYTPAELCHLIRRVAHAPAARINPGLPLKGWDRIAYKGGSDGNVLSMNYALERGDHHYCVSITWNGGKAALDELIPEATRLINTLDQSTPAIQGPNKS